MSGFDPARDGRYRALGAEAESEPGSRGRVLRNTLGIRSVRAMAREESISLLAATQASIDQTDRDHRFTGKDIRALHRLWLRDIYSWAGEYRHVNLAKGDFPFAAADQVPRLMAEFDRGPLKQFTPCSFAQTEDQARASRSARGIDTDSPVSRGQWALCALARMLMGLQAGLPALDFGGIRGVQKQRYIAAIHASLDRDYAPMKEVFKRVIARTLRTRVNVSGGGES